MLAWVEIMPGTNQCSCLGTWSQVPLADPTCKGRSEPCFWTQSFCRAHRASVAVIAIIEKVMYIKTKDFLSFLKQTLFLHPNECPDLQKYQKYQKPLVWKRLWSWMVSMHFSASWLLQFNVISTMGLRKILTQMKKMQLKCKCHMHHDIQ